MEQDHHQQTANLSASCSSTSSQFVDALPSNSHESLHTDHVLHQQLTILYSNAPDHRNSTFIYGSKPPWGWDFVLSFKMPRYSFKMPGSLEQTPILSDDNPNAANDSDGQKSSPKLNQREARLVEKDRDLVKRRIAILARLKTAGFVFSQLLVPSEGIIMVRISLPEMRLKAKAVNIAMELRLMKEFGGGYMAFQQEKEHVFVNFDEQEDRKCYFAPADRSIIIMRVLESKEDWGCDLNMEKLMHEGVILQAFSLHVERERDNLISQFVKRRIWDPTHMPPFGEMKNYLGGMLYLFIGDFGEQTPIDRIDMNEGPNCGCEIVCFLFVVFVSVLMPIARVTFYFVFVSFYARRLLIIALLSIPIYASYRALTNKLAIAMFRWIFSMGLSLWTTVFLETWKRRSAVVGFDWGLDDYKEDIAGTTRAQFVGDIRYGFYCDAGFVPLTDILDDAEQKYDAAKLEEGKPNVDVSNLPKNLYQDPIAARNARLRSLSVTSLFIIVVGSLTFFLLWWRKNIVDFFINRNASEGFSKAVPGILNGILITVFDSVWRTVSMDLTRRENHRTNQEFENSLVYKRFAFQFVSNYISLFFIAFIKPNLTNTKCIDGYEKNVPDCMVELETQLMSLVITKATIGQLTEIGIPFVTSKVKQWRSRKRSRASPTSENGGHPDASSADNRYVEEAHLCAYRTTIEDYGELIIQFGNLVLFGLAFPPAAVVASLNNLIEGRTDAYKILALSQRVNADDAADIGAWYSILELLNVMSVIVNSGLVVFTANSAAVVFGFNSFVWQGLLYNVLAFFIMEHVLLAVKGLAAFLIPDVPGRAKRQQARENYDIARWFDVGWKDAFRGNSLLEVDERQVGLCGRFADLFDQASDDGRDGEKGA